MTRQAKTYIAIAFLAVIALGGGWYFGSPRWTLHQMQSAAQAKDADKLTSYIDFPKLRESFKEQVKAKMAAELAKTKDDNPFAALGATLAMGMIDGMVDGLVTPAAMREVFANAPEPEPGEGKIGVRVKNLDFQRTGFSEFHLINREDKDGASLVFKREGLGWKMTEIRMPAGD